MNPATRDPRIAELLAARDLGVLSLEEQVELEQLLGNPDGANSLVGDLVLAADANAAPNAMPDSLRAALAARGRSIVGAPARTRSRRIGFQVAAAAALMLAFAGAWFGYSSWQRASRHAAELDRQVTQKELEAADLRIRLASAREQASRNDELLAQARQRVESMTREHETAIAAAAQRELDLATRLASATADLDRAALTIARYEAPADPAELAGNRRKLLDVPGTVRLAWQPFDVPSLAPTEQAGTVQGDVVWNDELQTGYLRFVGLKVNDPAVEQYQVWVIDERGLEQKVSGGVFNASAAGEVIVPIDPGIDVGRVALFAITVENPGGTWVPDLQRRVVVAPRPDGG